MRPTQALSVGRYRHLRLTTKDVGRGYYKGNRTGSMGRHTQYGGYVIEWDKVRTYAVPQNLKDCKVCDINQPGEQQRILTSGTAHAIREQADQGRLGRLQGPFQGAYGPLLLPRAMEAVQWSRLKEEIHHAI